MTVLATRRRRPEQDGVAEIHPFSALPHLLPRTHVLIITAPLTPETKGLIGERELDLLPRGALLVNVGRGAIVMRGLHLRLRSAHAASA
jgi:phosphoglycerate dehydrogenase-like enzyme